MLNRTQTIELPRAEQDNRVKVKGLSKNAKKILNNLLKQHASQIREKEKSIKQLTEWILVAQDEGDEDALLEYTTMRNMMTNDILKIQNKMIQITQKAKDDVILPSGVKNRLDPHTITEHLRRLGYPEDFIAGVIAFNRKLPGFANLALGAAGAAARKHQVADGIQNAPVLSVNNSNNRVYLKSRYSKTIMGPAMKALLKYFPGELQRMKMIKMNNGDLKAHVSKLCEKIHRSPEIMRRNGMHKAAGVVTSTLGAGTSAASNILSAAFGDYTKTNTRSFYDFLMKTAMTREDSRYKVANNFANTVAATRPSWMSETSNLPDSTVSSYTGHMYKAKICGVLQEFTAYQEARQSLANFNDVPLNVYLKDLIESFYQNVNTMLLRAYNSNVPNAILSFDNIFQSVSTSGATNNGSTIFGNDSSYATNANIYDITRNTSGVGYWNSSVFSPADANVSTNTLGEPAIRDLKKMANALRPYLRPEDNFVAVTGFDTLLTLGELIEDKVRYVETLNDQKNAFNADGTPQGGFNLGSETRGIDQFRFYGFDGLVSNGLNPSGSPVRSSNIYAFPWNSISISYMTPPGLFTNRNIVAEDSWTGTHFYGGFLELVADGPFPKYGSITSMEFAEA